MLRNRSRAFLAWSRQRTFLILTFYSPLPRKGSAPQHCLWPAAGFENHEDDPKKSMATWHWFSDSTLPDFFYLQISLSLSSRFTFMVLNQTEEPEGRVRGRGGGQLVIPPSPPDGPSGGVPDLLWYVAKVICSTVCPSRAHAEFILHVPVLPDGGGGEGGGFLDLKRVICDLTASIRSDTAGMMHFRPYKYNA